MDVRSAGDQFVTPQQHPGLRPPAPAAGDTKRAWRLLALVTLAALLVTLVGGGAGGFLLARTVKKASDRATCGALHCIPSLPVSSVIDALKGQGFACAEKAALDTWTCQLRIGDTRYESRIGQKSGLIYRLENSVRTERREVSDAAKAFLLWCADMPFANDPVLTEKINGWLVPRLGGGTDAKITVGHYAYSLTAGSQQSLRLEVWAGSR